MTQPAKVQEPSMEEILASIRRIIADDEAKPAAAEKAAPPPPSPQPSSPPPAAVAAAPAKPEKPAPAPVARAPVPPPAAPAPARAAAPIAPPPPPAPAPVASNSQDDIDALLNGLDEATTPEEIRSAAPEPEPEPESDVLDLTDEMALPDPVPQAAFKKVEPPDDLEFTETAAKAPLREMAFDMPPPSPMDSRPILSRTTVSAVESAFNSLAHTVLSNNARTLEDLVKEMLRPMLKSWLDDNLPGLVERIVKAEIERVSRGR
jgi:cell pole-organizing protein PopZ